MTETKPERAEQPWDRTSGPVHTWFELSYANFLVWHRTHMQSMPVEWQQRFADLAEELDAAYPDGTGVNYEVATVRSEYVSELTDAEMKQLGVTTGDDEDEAEDEAEWRERVWYLKDGQEVPGVHRVGIPVPDPVPHYRHAYLPPDEEAIAAHRRFREQLRAEEASSQPSRTKT